MHAERIALLATEARAAAELLTYAEARAAAGKPDAIVEDQALAFAAEVVHKLRSSVDADPQTFSLDPEVLKRLEDPELRAAIRAGLSEAFVRSIGARVIECAWRLHG